MNTTNASRYHWNSQSRSLAVPFTDKEVGVFQTRPTKVFKLRLLVVVCQTQICTSVN